MADDGSLGINAIAAVAEPKLTRSTCCYCGVGCGVLIESQVLDGQERITGVRGDPQHPANFGRLCTKGLNLANTVQNLEGRLLEPLLRTRRDAARQVVSWDAALDAAADGFARIIAEHGPGSVAFYLSGQLLTEDYFVFNKIAKGLIGSNHVDTNSRLCMSSAVTAYKKSLGADGPPTCYEDLELADCVLFAGSNMAYAHPILFRRLEAAKKARGQKWIVVDPRRTDTAASADLHLQIQPGTDVALFNAMLHHMIWEDLIDPAYIAAHTDGFAAIKQVVREARPSVAAEICGVAEADICQAAEWFARSPASLSLYCMGLNQSSHGTDKNLALINLHLATAQIGKPGAGPFSLTGQPNAMGGREVGGMATMLAAHRDIDNPQHRAEVAAAWGVPEAHVCAEPGLPAVAMFQALHVGKIKAIYIACTNPAHSMPNLPLVREALEKAELVIVQDCYSNIDTMAYADIALPATGWGEKEGTVTNSERRISRVRAAVPAAGQARGDWQIAVDFGQRLQTRLHPEWAPLFAYENSAQIYAEHVQLTAGRDLDISAISHQLLEEQGPQQWPYPAGGQAQARRYTDGRFATANGRAQFKATPYSPVADAISADYPLHLLTGRLRDQWHGMSRTGRVASLFQHVPEPSLNMHPQDAQAQNFEEGQLVRIRSKHGSFVLPVALSEDVAVGSVFAAMHWNGQFLNTTGANEVVGDDVCAQSFQPELKHTAVRLSPVALPWRCVLALRLPSHAQAQALHGQLQATLAASGYGSLVFAADGVLLLRSAHADMRPEWLATLLQTVGFHTDDDGLSYHDRSKGIFKQVCWQTADADGQAALRGFVFAGWDGSADAKVVESLLSKLIDNQAWEGSRLAAFEPSLANETPRDKVICNCKQVKESQIILLRKDGLELPAIQEQLGCGTVCGSCLPEVKRLCSAAVGAA